MPGNELSAAGGNRTVVAPRGDGFSVSEVTGTIAAALAQNSVIYARRIAPAPSVKRAFTDWMRLTFTTIVAFTTPITAGRRLAIHRASGAATTGGTGIAAASKKDPSSAGSLCDVALGGDIRIATTAALGVGGITVGDKLGELQLVHVGAAGGFHERVYEWHASWNKQNELGPGDLVVVRNPVAMDAAGTWQLGIEDHWHEAPAWF